MSASVLSVAPGIGLRSAKIIILGGRGNGPNNKGRSKDGAKRGCTREIWAPDLEHPTGHRGGGAPVCDAGRSFPEGNALVPRGIRGQNGPRAEDVQSGGAYRPAEPQRSGEPAPMKTNHARATTCPRSGLVQQAGTSIDG